jgi:beta-N-acetylhexosaminidase
MRWIALTCLWGCLMLACTRVQEGEAHLHQAPFFEKQLYATADSIIERMTVPQKLGQLIIWEPEWQGPATRQQLEQTLSTVPVGGVLFDQIPLSTFLDVRTKSQQSASPLLIGFHEQVVFNNQFIDQPYFPTQASIDATPDPSLKTLLNDVQTQQIKALGINWLHATTNSNKEVSVSNVLQTSDLEHFPWLVPAREALAFKSGYCLPGQLLTSDSLQTWPWGEVHDRLQQALNYRGLFFAKAKTLEEVAGAIQAGAHAVRTPIPPQPILQLLTEQYELGHFSTADLNDRVRHLLMAKLWMRQPLRLNQPPSTPVRQVGLLEDLPASSWIEDTLSAYFAHPYWSKLKRKVFKESAVLVHNQDTLLPFDWTYKRGFHITHIGPLHLKKFDASFAHYSDYTAKHLKIKNGDVLPDLQKLPQKGWTHIITLSATVIDTKRDHAFLHSLHSLALENEVVLINFGHAYNLEKMDTKMSLVQFFEINAINAELAPQLLFGGFAPRGKLPVAINDLFPEGTGQTFAPTRFEYANPEEVGIAAEKLVGIDAIAKTAIKERATPGCQVVVAKQGKIIYSKAFGHHTYDKKERVKKTDLYDIASITKVAATTLAVMDLYQKKQLKLTDKLRQHVDVPKNSTLKNLQLRKLMTHQSGLKPHLPVLPYLLYRDQPNAQCDSFFCKTQNEVYTVEVADSFYFDGNYLDQVWEDMNKERLGSQRRYRYSDANFYLLQKVVEEVSGKPLDQYVNHKFFYPLGLRYLGYRPLDEFPREQIIPTQKDDRWRFQELRGYVHDETAALMGGVAGNAGLFSNAEDLAVVFQMLLNGGSYGSQNLLDQSTIDYFVTAPRGSQRAYGFDKPYKRTHTAIAPSASRQSYGHTGFTGTCAWVDPQHELVFIFLSNRLHPNVKNRRLFRKRVRERMHEVVYDALDSFTEKPPVIDVELSRS